MVYAYQNWQQCQFLKCRKFFRVSFILIFVHHSLMTINFKLSFIPTPALQIWFSFYVFFIFIFWFKLRGACSVNLSPRLVKEWQFLLPFCNACWQWLDRIRGTMYYKYAMSWRQTYRYYIWNFSELQESICNSLRKNCFSISVTWLDPNW